MCYQGITRALTTGVNDTAAAASSQTASLQYFPVLMTVTYLTYGLASGDNDIVLALWQSKL